jgi:hypothetical protein
MQAVLDRNYIGRYSSRQCDHSPEKRATKPTPGGKVVLKALPPGFLDDLSEDEQRAISARIGRPNMLMGYGRDGRAKLEFIADDDSIHTLYVDLKFIKRW